MKRFVSLTIIVLFAIFPSFGQDAAVKSPKKTPEKSQAIKDPSTVKRDKTYSTIEIFKQIRAVELSKEGLIKLLGEPDYKGKLKGNDLWQYYNLTQDEVKKDVLWHQYFLIENGKVSYDWVSKTAGPPRPGTAK